MDYDLSKACVYGACFISIILEEEKTRYAFSSHNILIKMVAGYATLYG